MRGIPFSIGPLAAASVLGLAAAPSALAAGGVYGGSTKDGDAIAMTTDAAGTKLTTAVIAWRAECDDGMGFPVAIKLTATTATPGFRAGPRDLVMSRNGKGRFAGQEAAGVGVGDGSASVLSKLSGKLGPKSASGTLSAEVHVLDAQGNRTTTCRTGALRWSASRGAGRIYAGATSQEEPVVVRLDSARKKVADMFIGWRSRSCTTGALLTFGERFDNFALASTGRFGDAFQQSFDMDDGGKIRYAYDLAGKLGRTSAKGTFHVGVMQTDAAGGTAMTCDSGGIRWKAATG